MTSNNQKSATDAQWMRVALAEARNAMDAGELPIATVVVASGEEAIRSQTQVVRRGSLVAHGETCAFLDLGTAMWGLKRPITLFTTCEPCIMCLGAAMQYGIERIVYGMRAAPDGGARFADTYRAAGLAVPELVAAELESDAVDLMREYLRENPESPGSEYAAELLAPYGGRN